MATLGRDPNKTRTELAAGETGGRAVQEAQHTALQLGEAKQQRQAQSFQHLDMQRQQDRHHGQELAEQSRSNRMRESIAQDEQDIVKADKGLEQEGPSRADRLRQEMEQGRLQAQMDKPLEIAGPGRATIAQSPERQAADKATRESTELNARARFADATRRLQMARISGDKEAAKKASAEAEDGAKSASALATKFKKNGGMEVDGDDWKTLELMATKLGDTHMDPALQQEITSRTAGPRVHQFLQANVDQWGLRYIAATGDMPSGNMMSMGSPVMRALTASAEQVASFLRQADQATGGAFSQGMKIDSLEKRNGILQKMAAEYMLFPSQGGQSARPQPSGDAIENPGGGPPLLRSRDDIKRSAERGAAERPKPKPESAGPRYHPDGTRKYG